MRSASAWRVTLVWFALVCLAAAQAPEPQKASLAVGPVVVAAIKGDVVIHAAGGAALPSLRGQSLTAGTIIETRKGSIVLDLADGSQAQVKDNTRLELKDPVKDQGFSLELFLGKVLTKIKKKLNPEPSFRLGTPTAVITVRGTQFLTEVDKKGKTEVSVYEGIVEVQGLVPESKPVFVRPGFFTEVPPHRPPREPLPIDMNLRGVASAQDDRWNGTGTFGHSSSDQSSPSQRGSDSAGRSQQSSGGREKED